MCVMFVCVNSTDECVDPTVRTLGRRRHRLRKSGETVGWWLGLRARLGGLSLEWVCVYITLLNVCREVDVWSTTDKGWVDSRVVALKIDALWGSG